VDVHLVVGGLRTGSGAALEPTTRRYILEHWQAVTEATGQPFKLEGALPDGFVYDTEPACRALVTARSLAPDCAWKLLGLIQQAFYAKAAMSLRPACWWNWRNRPVCRASNSPRVRPCRSCTPRPQADFTWVQDLGIAGFPTLLAERNGQLALLTNGYQPLSELSPLLGRWLERAACA
jgi:putative protein-disulfide isomerase